MLNNKVLGPNHSSLLMAPKWGKNDFLEKNVQYILYENKELSQ